MFPQWIAIKKVSRDPSELCTQGHSKLLKEKCTAKWEIKRYHRALLQNKEGFYESLEPK